MHAYTHTHTHTHSIIVHAIYISLTLYVWWARATRTDCSSFCSWDKDSCDDVGNATDTIWTDGPPGLLVIHFVVLKASQLPPWCSPSRPCRGWPWRRRSPALRTPRSRCPPTACTWWGWWWWQRQRQQQQQQQQQQTTTNNKLRETQKRVNCLKENSFESHWKWKRLWDNNNNNNKQQQTQRNPNKNAV